VIGCLGQNRAERRSRDEVSRPSWKTRNWKIFQFFAPVSSRDCESLKKRGAVSPDLAGGMSPKNFGK